MPRSLNPMKARLLPTLCALIASAVGSTAATLEIREGDHICLIGNTLAERMQFEGHNHWETLLHQRFPKHKLVVRNLAWPADEVVLRPRAEGFGTPDEHLTFCKADVVIAFFGFNESFAGEAGLEKFKSDLEEWIKHTKSQDYSGKGAPRIALVSPIAAEASRAFQNRDPIPPSNEGQPLVARIEIGMSTLDSLNTRLKLYTNAMRDVAARNGVVFADVFEKSRGFYSRGYVPPFEHATINGVHLNGVGDSSLGAELDEVFFGKGDNQWLYQEHLRREIQAKSRLWYDRYRIVDSYYVYGGRSGLKFADGDQTNRDVMQREREVLDVMCANRDERIWKLAQGQAVPEKCDDSNAPPFLDVRTSFGVNQRKDAGANTGQTSKTAEGSSAQIPSVAETLKKFTLAKGFKVECFASEEDFPELANATSMAFDARGRLWVCTMPSYPQWRPGEEFRDKIVILEDSDGDGRANYATTFADKLHLPISFEFYDGGILVSGQRSLLFLKDTDGDDKADVKEVVLSGFDSADSHHVINAFTYGPGGDLYFQEGTFHHTQVETPYGPVRCKNAGTYRYEPRTGRLSVFVSYNYANPHGIAFDKWGQTFIADASGGMNYFATAFSGHLPYPEKHGAMQPFFPKRVRPTSGCEFVSSRNFPDDMQGNFLLNNCIGVQGTLNHTVKAAGSGYEGKEVEPLMLNSDPNFRPVDMEFGPDGALYVVDWAEALIGHMQYSIRDPLRDKTHGRIWRIWNGEKPLVRPVKIAGEPIEKLLGLLKEPEQRTRERVKKELATRSTAEVMTAVEKWRRSNSGDEPAQLEALWIHQWHNAASGDLLKQVLQGKQPEARAAAVRVLCYWQDRVSEALGLLKAAAKDSHPLVRLEAVRACSFLGEDPTLAGVPGNGAGRKEAINIALEILKHPMDYYLSYTLGETMRALKPAPADIDMKANPAALAYVLGKMTNDELKAAPREVPVLEALLQRDGIDAATREAAAGELARKRGTTRETELIQAVVHLDEQNKDVTASADLGKLLAASPPEALKKANDLITRMGTKDHGVRSARIAGMAAWVAMLGSPESIYQQRKDNHETLAALFDSAVLISDPALRAKFQPLLVETLGGQIPAHLRKAALLALPLTGPDHAAANFALLTEALLKGQERSTAASAAMQLPRTAWDKAKARPVAESILAYARTVPATQRTRQDYVEAAQFAMELCSLIPGETGGRLRKSLRDLGVSVFVIKTVREQMRYDTPQIVVEAGKPFEVIFENNDIMPHNMVFIEPGSRIEIGTAAQSMPMVPDAQGFLYIPPHKGILPKAFTKMLEPGEKARLQLVAPLQPGDYEYVCTFPGHWMIMFGKMIVAKDVEVYLQKAAAAK
jgi:glucose/arabinose dehydrogenase/azurin